MDVMLENAYTIYEKNLLTLATISDTEYNFISVSDFAELLNTILGVKSIRPQQVTQFLIDNNVIAKKDRIVLNKQLILKQKPNKYTIVQNNIKQWVKEEEFQYSSKTITFYLWNGFFIFKLLGINFKESISLSDASRLCNTFNKSVKEILNEEVVYYNLLCLQRYFQQYLIPEI